MAAKIPVEGISENPNNPKHDGPLKPTPLKDTTSNEPGDVVPDKAPSKADELEKIRKEKYDKKKAELARQNLVLPTKVTNPEDPTPWGKFGLTEEQWDSLTPEEQEALGKIIDVDPRVKKDEGTTKDAVLRGAVERAIAIITGHNPKFKALNKTDLIGELKRLLTAGGLYGNSLSKEEEALIRKAIAELEQSGYKPGGQGFLEKVGDFFTGTTLESLKKEATRLEGLKKAGAWSPELEQRLTDVYTKIGVIEDGDKEIQTRNDEDDAKAEADAEKEFGKEKKPDIGRPELWTHKGLQYEITEYDEFNRPVRGFQIINGERTKTEKRFDLGPVKYYRDPKTGEIDKRYIVMATRGDGKPTLLYDTVDKVEIVKDYPNDPEKTEMEMIADQEKKALTKVALEKIKANENLRTKLGKDEDKFDEKWDEIEESLDDIQDNIDKNTKRFDETYEQYANAEVNENEYWDDKGFFQIVGLGLGLMLGSIGAAGLGKSKSTALLIVEKAIDRNIKAQEFNIKKGDTLMSRLNTRLTDLGLTKYRLETIGKSIMLERQKIGIQKQLVEAEPAVRAALELAVVAIDKKLATNKQEIASAIIDRNIKSSVAARGEEKVQRERYNKLIKAKVGEGITATYSSIQSLLSADKPVTHHSISYELVKLIDPESKGVTDVDVKTMKKGLGGSMYNRFEASINKFIYGKDLTDKTKEDIQIMMKIILWNKLKAQREINRKFREDTKILNRDNPQWHGRVKVRADLIVDTIDYKKYFPSARDRQILEYLIENPGKTWDEVFKKHSFGVRKGWRIDNKAETE